MYILYFPLFVCYTVCMNHSSSPAQGSKQFYEKQKGDNLFYHHINTTLLKDIYPIDIGYEKHTSKTPFSNKYPYYLLHFVKSGKGSIEFDGVCTELPKNTLFVLPPDKTITYYPRPNWEYYWINFNGTAVKNILAELGITDSNFKLPFADNAPVPLFRHALYESSNKLSQALTVTYSLFAIFTIIAKQYPPAAAPYQTSQFSFDKIFDYLRVHLYDPTLSAKNVAEHFFISDTYFSILFKKNVNTSFKEYVNYERIKKATELLETTDLIIKEIAESVGYADPLYFSKVFKRYRLISPLDYRRSVRHES